MEKFKKILIGTMIITLYLNIGWMMGTYVHERVKYSDDILSESSFAQFLSGGWHIFNTPQIPEKERESLFSKQMFFSLFWPVLLIFVVMTWIVYAFAWLIMLLAKLIFIGGLAELVGTAGMIIITCIAVGILTVYVMRGKNKSEMKPE